MLLPAAAYRLPFPLRALHSCKTGLLNSIRILCGAELESVKKEIIRRDLHMGVMRRGGIQDKKRGILKDLGPPGRARLHYPYNCQVDNSGGF